MLGALRAGNGTFAKEVEMAPHLDKSQAVTNRAVRAPRYPAVPAEQVPLGTLTTGNRSDSGQSTTSSAICLLDCSGLSPDCLDLEPVTRSLFSGAAYSPCWP